MEFPRGLEVGIWDFHPRVLRADCFMENAPLKNPRVIIIGAGFGGLEAAKKFAGEAVRVTVVDRTNYHLFQPLLYQVATAALSPADIAAPVRAILSKCKNMEVTLAEVQSIDVNAKKVKMVDGELDYDYLIVATGARHSYFGHPEWEKLAPGLKSLEDAVEIRRRILMAFEYAERSSDEAARKAAMTFAVVGGGPTGVEMAGAIAEIARYTLAKDFRHIDPSQARVILVESEPRVLAAFPEDLQISAMRQLVDLGVEVRIGVHATNLSEQGLQVGDEFIPCRVKIWAAGNNASFVGNSLGAPIDRAGRVIVNQDLTIPGHPEVQVIGDLANFSHQTGQPLPGVSPVAMQQGRHAARNILAMIDGRKPQRFWYFDKGSMATIGRNKAVADLKLIHLSGIPAWLAWLFVHVIFLVGFRNRLAVLFQWAWAYFSFNKGARLITRNFQSEQRPPT
ncbi:MAG: NAD(P)/FAD-dependent oxidoreductase [Verrucomicrobiota bacterium]|nr:NAD(P)/FAD-dependent oxidoreductase [Verrucomicrobiota bacterium]